MINFKVVRYKNLLSTGNEFTEIKLNEKKTTLIVGRNGAGKSSFLDALSYCLYNKAFRNINKPQLMNSITGKGLLVEVEFDIAGREYLVRRGQKPNIFEIYQDGKLLNQVADNRDYQAMLEQNIIRMNQRSFRQIVVLGSANFIPFMQLTALQRREVIEDLLDIQVFSVMNTLLKNRIAQNKEDIQENQHQIELCENMIAMQRKHLQELRQNNDDLIHSKQEKIREYEEEIESLFSVVRELNNSIRSLEENLSSTDWSSKLLETKTIRSKVKANIESVTKKNVFYQENDTCPTCRQSISKKFKQEAQETCTSKLHKYQTGLTDLDERISKIEKRLAREKEITSQIQQLNSQVTETNVKINSNNRFIAGIQKEIDDLKIKVRSFDEVAHEDNNYQLKLSNYNKERNELLTNRETLGVAASLLKDGGIKAMIIKQYVPVMNKLINKYLQMMEFYVDFNLDENFKESIHSRGRDDFSYDSFSQGEKMRIDLALLFSWRAIAKMRNSASTNLLVFDEIFDSSLDTQGTDDFIKVIQNLTTDTNTFIISHKVDTISDKFDTVISFVKEKNFSRIKQVA